MIFTVRHCDGLARPRTRISKILAYRTQDTAIILLTDKLTIFSDYAFATDV